MIHSLDMKIGECGENLVIFNPVVNYSQSVCDRVDMYIESPWKHLMSAGVVPDYTKMSCSSGSAASMDMDMYHGWRESMPLLYKSSCGDVNAVRDLLRGAVNVNKQDWNSWTALHYASWQGHDEVVKLLLSQSDIQPNAATDLGYTPLHFACGRGHHMVVKTLLEIGDIDHKARDKSQRSPLDLCKSSQSFAGPTGESLNLCQRYLKAHAERDPMTLSVLMPDGSEKCVVLESGSNTTAGHILTQLNLTSQTSLMFALSVTSDALTIQLRPEIKPLHVLKNWSKMVGSNASENQVISPLTNGPLLALTRDIRVVAEMDAVQTEPQCVSFLFHQARTHYLSRCCVVSEATAVQLSTILALIYDVKPQQIHCESPDLVKIISHRKTSCRKFVKKVKANVKQNLEEIRDASHRHLLQEKFRTIARKSITYGSSFFHGVTAKGFNSLIAVNANGLHVITKPNSPQSELRFSYPFELFNIELNKEKSASFANSNSSSDSIQHSFTVSAVQGAKNPFAPLSITSLHAKLIVSLVNTLANRRSGKEGERARKLSPLSVRTDGPMSEVAATSPDLNVRMF